MRLSAATLGAIAPEVARPQYDSDRQGVGIVHIGIGAFHRAHQAWYTHRAMEAGCRDWMIAGVSLRSAGVARQMNPQDGLYTLSERSDAGSQIAVISSIREVLVAADSHAAIASALAAPATRIVSLTVTEKGYCRKPDGSLDHALAGGGSIYCLLADAFASRRTAGAGGLTLLSCDNLSGNGAQLQRLMGEYLDRHDPGLRAWFEAECACPSTMVDRIVPATTDHDRAEVAAAIGLEDQAAVMTEPFSQWVIEDRFAGPRPDWGRVGAELVGNVEPYELAKLRMLNGAHSALAYLGLAAGHEFVHQAIADPHIRPLVDRLMKQEAATSLTAAPGQDLMRYADGLLARFANPALAHRLAQIAMDGSQKLPQRWLETLAFHQSAGRQCPAILTGLAAWLRHARGDNAARCGALDDPLAARIEAFWRDAGRAGIVDAMFGPRGLMASQWHPDPAERAGIEALL